MERSDNIGGLGGHKRLGGDQQPGMVVNHVEDLHLGAVGELPVGGVGLPALVGELGLETPPGALRSLLGWGAMKPRRDSTRQIVATDGAAPRARPRRRRSKWTWIVCGPASRPSSARDLRTATISSSIIAGTFVGDDQGRFDRGTSAASPCSR